MSRVMLISRLKMNLITFDHPEELEMGTPFFII